jgi:hypothetical protein
VVVFTGLEEDGEADAGWHHGVGGDVLRRLTSPVAWSTTFWHLLQRERERERERD